jgi:adenine-specific DNA-methyltransferase
MVLESLKTAGVQQAHKEDHIAFTSLVPWPGEFICAEGIYLEGDPIDRPRTAPCCDLPRPRIRHGIAA